MIMEKIIPPIDRDLLEKELTPGKLVRDTNNGNNKIYILTYRDSPLLMQELGRLREITFREAGGGTGKAADIDEFDVGDKPFKQLIVWNPADREIVGGYRFIHGKDTRKDQAGNVLSPTAELFHYSERFVSEYWPYTVELGRSFVQPNYQPTTNIRKGMYSLDNLWDGLGAIIVDNPELRYFFGKITMYPHFNILARDLILHFMHKYFPDKEKLVVPIRAVEITTDTRLLDAIFTGATFAENYKILAQRVRSLNESIPPLVNAYMNLSSTMKTFGTSLNPGFGDTEETAIIITISDIYDLKKDRHLSTYKGSPEKP